MDKKLNKEITNSKAIKILTKPIEQDTVAVGNDADLYRSVEKALGADVIQLAEKYRAVLSQKIIGEASEQFLEEVEKKALDLGRAYVIRRILSKRKQILDIALDRAANDPKGQSILIKLIDVLLGNAKTGGGRVTKKTIEERKVSFENIANPNRPDSGG